MHKKIQQIFSNKLSVRTLPIATIRREEKMVKSLFLMRHCVGNSGFRIVIPTFPFKRAENNLSCND